MTFLQSIIVTNFLFAKIFVSCIPYKLLKLNFAICLVFSLSSWWQQPLRKTYVALLPLGNQELQTMMMNCFCGMVDRRKAFSLISSRDHCQRSSPSRISGTPRVGFEPAQSLSSGLVESSCTVVITTTPRLSQS